MDQRRSLGELLTSCLLLGSCIIRRRGYAMGWTRGCRGRINLGDVFEEVFAVVIHEYYGRKAEAEERTQKRRFRSHESEASEDIGRDCGDAQGLHIEMQYTSGSPLGTDRLPLYSEDSHVSHYETGFDYALHTNTSRYSSMGFSYPPVCPHNYN